MNSTLDSFVKVLPQKRKNSESPKKETESLSKKKKSPTPEPSPPKKESPKKASEKKASEKKASEKKAPEKKTPEKKTPEKTSEKPPSNSKFYSTYEEFIDQLDTWKEPLKTFIQPPKNANMKFIYDFVKKAYETKTIYPPKDLLFNAFKTTPWDKVRVVIIGQDPYPNPGDAMGLSFSVPRNQKTPPSLLNIYKCLNKDSKIKMKIPGHGDLTKWAEEGVFLLNATLTVEHKKANSHQKDSGWSLFTDYVISEISKQKKNIVFLLWGRFAINKKKLIDSNKHLIIENIHPSPLAQAKGDFTESDQFSKCNEYLKKNSLPEIDWKIE